MRWFSRVATAAAKIRLALRRGRGEGPGLRRRRLLGFAGALAEEEGAGRVREGHRKAGRCDRCDSGWPVWQGVYIQDPLKFCRLI